MSTPGHRAPPQQQPRHPAPQQQRQPEPEPARPAPAPRDSAPVHALRVTAYVLTSLASLLFIALVIYGYVALQQIGNALSSNPLFGGSSYSAPAVPDGSGTGDNYANLCAQNPQAPECNGTGG